VGYTIGQAICPKKRLLKVKKCMTRIYPGYRTNHQGGYDDAKSSDIWYTGQQQDVCFSNVHACQVETWCFTIELRVIHWIFCGHNRLPCNPNFSKHSLSKWENQHVNSKDFRMPFPIKKVSLGSPWSRFCVDIIAAYPCKYSISPGILMLVYHPLMWL
jgi:hypothetical protein